MKQEVTPNGLIRLTEVYNPVIFQTESGDYLSVMMRDKGYDCIYNGKFMRLERELDEFELANVSQAMRVLSTAIKGDEGYRATWNANIAMAFQDEFKEWIDHMKIKLPAHLDVHRIANNAAERFLDSLITSGEEKAKGSEVFDELHTNEPGEREQLLEEYPMTPDEAFETQPTTGFVTQGESIPFKSSIEPELLSGIALGTYYASKHRNYNSANIFGARFAEILGDMTEIGEIRQGIEEFAEDFTLTSDEIDSMEKYCKDNIQKIWRETYGSNDKVEEEEVKEDTPDHGMYVKESRLYKGLICYRIGDKLYSEGALNPFRTDYDSHDSVIDYSGLEETTNEYDHILYRYEGEGEFVRGFRNDKSSTKDDSSEAGKQKQDDSPVELPEWFKLIDFDNIDKLNNINKLIEDVYPELRYNDPKPSNPCANCSEYINAQRLGKSLICNCTIPYMHDTPLFIGNTSGYSFTAGSDAVDMNDLSGITFFVNGTKNK